LQGPAGAHRRALISIKSAPGARADTCAAAEETCMAALPASETYNDTVVYQFSVMTVVWGIVGMLVGVLIAASCTGRH
jgi:hypothetical protein